PEHLSGHSTFSAASFEVLRSFTGTGRLGLSVTIPAGSSRVEPGLTPAAPVTLTWRTMGDAADEAGISPAVGGMPVHEGPLGGRRGRPRLGAAGRGRGLRQAADVLHCPRAAALPRQIWFSAAGGAGWNPPTMAA